MVMTHHPLYMNMFESMLRSLKLLGLHTHHNGIMELLASRFIISLFISFLSETEFSILFSLLQSQEESIAVRFAKQIPNHLGNFFGNEQGKK